MNQHLTEITFILDRSGSMQSMTESAIAGFNHFLKDQTGAEGQARLTLVLFDDRYEVPCQSVPIEEVTDLDTTTFVPRGSTALLDAIGKSIDDLGDRLHHCPEAERPGKIIVAILTDGQENASRAYTWHDIQQRIQHQTDHYQWEFLFLGANQDGIATASQMGIAAHNAATWQADEIGARTSSGALSRKMRELRKFHSSPPEKMQSTPMADFVNEEDRKERGKE